LTKHCARLGEVNIPLRSFQSFEVIFGPIQHHGPLPRSTSIKPVSVPPVTMRGPAFQSSMLCKAYSGWTFVWVWPFVQAVMAG
jgi:hypothetical protein